MYVFIYLFSTLQFSVYFMGMFELCIPRIVLYDEFITTLFSDLASTFSSTTSFALVTVVIRGLLT